jgi:prepilin-type N-terminal cleavage/methylation domain-containing protein
MLKSQKGFTLIEVLISLAILGIIAIGCMRGLTAANKAVYYTESRETAKNVAESQMEFVKLSKFSSSYTPYTPATPPAYWSRYATTITVAPVPGNANQNIQKVTVTISYTDIYTEAPVQFVLEDFKVDG